MSGNVIELSGNCLVPKREGRLRDFGVGKVAFFTNKSRKISLYRKSPKWDKKYRQLKINVLTFILSNFGFQYQFDQNGIRIGTKLI